MSGKTVGGVEEKQVTGKMNTPISRKVDGRTGGSDEVYEIGLMDIIIFDEIVKNGRRRP